MSKRSLILRLLVRWSNLKILKFLKFKKDKPKRCVDMEEQEKEQTQAESKDVENEQSVEPIDSESKETVEENSKEQKEVSEVSKLKQEAEDFKNRYYYAVAEMENMKKRFDRERQNFIKYGNEKILSALLEVADNLDRTIDAIANDEDEKVKNIVAGIGMVKKSFVNILQQNGLTEVESVGKIFDPNFHDAIGQQKAEGKEELEIITEYQKGYVLNGRLLRAAKVVVTKNKED